jgi:hypothetical protein
MVRLERIGFLVISNKSINLGYKYGRLKMIH